MAIGDHLVVDRGAYTHHGVDVGDGTVIHYSGEPTSKRDATIRRTSRWLFCRGNSTCVTTRPADAAEALARAKACLGLDGYSLLGRNCEHFAAWAVTGVAVSIQVERVLQQASAALLRSAATGGPAQLAGWAMWDFGHRLCNALRERVDAARYIREYGALWQGDSWLAPEGRPFALVRSLNWVTPTPEGLAAVAKPSAGTLAFRLWMDPLQTVFVSSPDSQFFLVGADGVIALAAEDGPPPVGAPIPTLLRSSDGVFAAIERTGLSRQRQWAWVD